MKTMIALADRIEPVTTDTHSAIAYDRFSADENLLIIAVVDLVGRPVGVLERNAFALKMGAEYGRALYAHRPVSLLMDPEPTIVDGNVSVLDFMSQSLLESPAQLLEGFIVTQADRFVGVGSALSLLQAQNESVRLHMQEAQAALRSKSEFLAIMSHEIRTPLNGVLAVADMVKRQLQQPELQPSLDIIIRSGEALLGILNDALDLSRAEAGRLELNETDFPIAGLLDDVQALWQPRADELGLHLITSLIGQNDQWLRGDVTRIKQVLNNLVSNALKFTKQGSVEIQLSTRSEGDGLTLRGEVRDSGVGIAAEELDKLFTPFSQTESGRKTSGGTGLGLAICRQLVETMKGRIEAASNVGRGSTFTFEVALKPQLSPAEGGPVHTKLISDSSVAPHILIADDNATNVIIAQMMCQLFGCTYVAAQNGAEALERARVTQFDLILMDIKMPIMDGLEATRHIRQLTGANRNIPIIALTANAGPSDIQNYLANGMDAVVEKPIKPDALWDKMRSLMAAPRVTVAA